MITSRHKSWDSVGELGLRADLYQFQSFLFLLGPRPIAEVVAERATALRFPDYAATVTECILYT
eukprot:2827209-Amphidinium_carterae.1